MTLDDTLSIEVTQADIEKRATQAEETSHAKAPRPRRARTRNKNEGRPAYQDNNLGTELDRAPQITVSSSDFLLNALGNRG